MIPLELGPVREAALPAHPGFVDPQHLDRDWKFPPVGPAAVGQDPAAGLDRALEEETRLGLEVIHSGETREGATRFAGILAFALMAAMYQPILRFYRLSPLWGLAQPAVGMFYTGCVVWSGWQHWRGQGGMWKGRAQAIAGR